MTLNDFIHNVCAYLPSLAPFHVLTYSTLLGTELYQSFVVTKICYQALPRSAFTTLQKNIFPVYFRGQSLMLVLTAITFPPYGPVSLMKNKWDWIPFAIAGVTAGLNIMVYGPRTRKIMIDRVHQGTRDSQSYGTIDDRPSISDDMQVLNRAFSRAHAMSIHLNLITIAATLWYGWRLASRLQIKAD